MNMNENKAEYLKNAPRFLRLIADGIEQGDYGKRVQVGLITKDLDADTINISGYGDNYTDIGTLLVEARDRLVEAHCQVNSVM